MQIQVVSCAVYNGKHMGRPPDASMQKIRQKVPAPNKTSSRGEWMHLESCGAQPDQCAPRVAEAQLAEKVWSRTVTQTDRVRGDVETMRTPLIAQDNAHHAPGGKA